MPSTTGTYRAPYHSSYGDHNHGYGYHYPHNHVVIVSSVWPYWGWGYPYAYGWGYPYYGLGYSGFFNDSDNYDSQQPSYYVAPQDYYNVPYQQPQPEDQQQQQPPESYPQQPQQPVPQQPSGSRAPYSGAQAPPPGSQALTVVFKDDRPPEHVYNYLLTANTLTVLDQNRHDIPVDEINLEATAQVNIQAGVEFSLPVRTP